MLKFLLVLFFSSPCLLWGDELPKWVSSPQSGCSADEFCAVGMGAGRDTASADARLAVAKFFKMKISGKSQLAVQSDTGGDSFGNFYEKISEEVAQDDLKGIELREVVDGGDSFYALAVINKRKMQNVWKDEIQKIDEEVVGLKKQNNYRAAKEMENQLYRREVLAERVRLFGGVSAMPAPVTKDELAAIIKQTSDKIKIKIEVSGQENGAVSEIQKYLVSLINQFHLRLVTEAKFTHRLRVELVATEIPMKVDGFVKYRLNLDARNFDENSIGVGAINFSGVFVGRSKEQAINSGLPIIKEYLEQNFDKLKFE